MTDQVLIYELRVNSAPESIVTHSIEEVCAIVRKVLTAEPRANPAMIKVRRARMSKTMYEGLPDVEA